MSAWAATPAAEDSFPVFSPSFLPSFVRRFRTAPPRPCPAALGFRSFRLFQNPREGLPAAQGPLQIPVGPGKGLRRVAVRLLLEDQEGRHGLPEVFLERALRAEHRAHLRLRR